MDVMVFGITIDSREMKLLNSLSLMDVTDPLMIIVSPSVFVEDDKLYVFLLFDNGTSCLGGV